MFANWRGIPAAPPVSGLVAAAARPDLPRWEEGIAWVPERCELSHQLVPWCADANDSFEPDAQGAAYHRPVAVRFAEQCSTMGGSLDAQERLRRRAEANTPFAVAREFWTGVATQDDPYVTRVGDTERTNFHLASDDAEVIGGSPANAAVGIGRLEQAAMEHAGGQNVVLHVPLVLLPQVEGHARPVGNTLVTQAGNVIVADAGYPGTGPEGQAAGATVWAYATSPVAVFIGALSSITEDVDAVDYRTNHRTLWASRPIAAVADPCLHLATEIEL